MFRKKAWRNTASDAVAYHQDQALSTTMFLLNSFGPTGFLLREEGEAKSFKVCLGDTHTCTCPVSTKEQEPCKHICWVLLRKFGLPREHEYSFQHGLVERQILEVLQGLHQIKPHQNEYDTPTTSGTPKKSVCRKEIQAEVVCPICQEELLEKKYPVTYCRLGCGNNVHVSCMKVWADHQKVSDMKEMVTCPLCRKDFSSLRLLKELVRNTSRLFTAAEREKPDRHLGVLCHNCRVYPVTGKCFKCTVCSYFYLCEDCVTQGCHPQHLVASRSTRREKWRLVQDLQDEPNGATSQSEHDGGQVVADPLPDSVLDCLPIVRVRRGSRLLDEGLQCRICLHAFTLDQRVRTLPCHHKFHKDCVDQFLRKSNSCPLDGFVIYNPLKWKTSDRKASPKLSPYLCGDSFKPSDVFVSGVALEAAADSISFFDRSSNLQSFTGIDGKNELWFT
ncbi:E3 ubiquitin-protein ligase ZSWIM2 [Pholidichthys leucotaenia]